MARQSIIAKLKTELQEQVISERQVVYILVEVRKLIEIQQDGANYRALKFCCDWVAHPVLNRVEAQNIVRQFDKYQEMMDAMHSATDAEVQPADLNFLRTFEEMLKLSKFRAEFGEYLKVHGLDSRITNDNQEWTNFLTHYTRVIEDCPLKCVGQSLKYVDEVVLRVIDVQPESVETGSDYRLMIRWSWFSKVSGIESNNVRFY